MRTEVKKCDVCGKEFKTRSKSPERERFCGEQCYRKFWNDRMREKERAKAFPISERPCEACGKMFTPKPNVRRWARTCSPHCRSIRMRQIRSKGRADRQDLSPRPCENCGKEFIPSIFNWRTQKYCSSHCAGLVASRSYDRRNPKKGTDRARRRRYDGNWQLVLDRDGHRCQICGSTEKLTVHHWDGTGKDEEPNHDLENLMTTCTSCHGKLHHVKVRVLAGEVYVVGEVFDLLRVDSVKVLRREKQ